MRALVRRLPLAAAALLTASLADAYPIEPVTLWQLAERADLIVLARVMAVEPSSNDADPFDQDTARLQILETWKGSAGGEIAVTFNQRMFCPAPPVYTPGEAVLAFLQSGASRIASLPKDVSAEDLREWTASLADRWLTVGLSYGTLYPEADDLPFVHDLVDDAVVLQARLPVPAADERAWHVRAATRRVTRWQGLHALRRAELVSDPGPDRARTPASTADERREVMRGFILEPSDDRTLPMTLSFVGTHPEPEFDRAVLGQLERLLAEDDMPRWVGESLARMAERYGSRSGMRDLRLKADCCGEIDVPALRRDWKKTRERYGVPLVPPAPEPRREKPGTGGSTY